MATRFQVNAAVPRGRRQRKSFGHVGSLAQAPDALVAARLRRLWSFDFGTWLQQKDYGLGLVAIAYAFTALGALIYFSNQL